MGRRRTDSIQKTTEKWIKEGRGQGKGEQYSPWLTPRDVSSLGRCSRVQSEKINRTHVVLSDLELMYLNILLWDDDVIDISEQYPLLPVDETLRIANSLGIVHPRKPGTNETSTMTTDFLIEVRDSNGIHLEARYVKYSSDLVKPRNKEKLKIEIEYWSRRNIPLRIITENSFNKVKAKNIERILSYTDHMVEGLSDKQFFEITDILVREIIESRYKKIRLNQVTTQIDIKLGLQNGTALSSFFYLVKEKTIPVHMNIDLIGTKMIDEIIDWDCIELKTVDMEEKHGFA